MTEKIQTRPFQFGNEKEATWPPRFPTCKGGFSGYWDKEKQVFVEGHPPVHQTFDSAPAIITDTIQEYYHPKAGIWVDSKSRLNDIDKALGTITTDKIQPADPTWRKDQERIRKKDAHDALHKAVAQIDAGTALLSEETRALCDIQNGIVSNALGMDAYNAVGRKKNAKGKRYRKR